MNDNELERARIFEVRWTIDGTRYGHEIIAPNEAEAVAAANLGPLAEGITVLSL